MSLVLFGQLLAVVAALCGAISSIIYSNIGKKVSSDLIAFIRMLFALPVMFLFAYLVEGNGFEGIATRDLIILLISGFIGFFITDLFMFRAYAIYGAEETMVVLCLAPVISAILSRILFSEFLSLNQIAGIILILIGIALVSMQDIGKGSKFISLGLIYALLAAVLQSISDMSSKLGLGEMPFITAASLRAVGGLFGWFLFVFVKRKTIFQDWPKARKPRFLVLLFCTVMIGTVMGTISAIGALKYAPAGIVTSLKQMSPVLILPYDFFVLRKRSWKSVVGTFVAVFGAIILFV